MMTTVKIAWRNIWRTPLRSLIVIGSIVLGIWSGFFVIAFCYGLNSQRTVNRIESAVSHIQIHHSEFDHAPVRLSVRLCEVANQNLPQTDTP